MIRQQLEDTLGNILAELQLKELPASSSACVVFCECVMPGELLCSLELAQAAGQQERNTVAELQVELVGFKDCIRVAEGELAKNAPLIAQLNHANQNMGNRVSLSLCVYSSHWLANALHACHTPCALCDTEELRAIF